MKKIYKKKNYQYLYFKKEKNVKAIIEKRYNIMIGIILVVMITLFLNLFYVQILQHEFYVNRVSELKQNLVKGTTAPRGRIYDRNHRLIVDNVPTKIIAYQKQSQISTKDEIELSYKIADLIEVPFTSLGDLSLKNFWIKQNEKSARAKITEEEWKKLDERKLSLSEIEDLKLERVTDEDLKHYTDRDREAAMVYSLMNKGYSYAEKVIKKDNVTDEEYAIISENLPKLPGFDTRLDWDRQYLYGNVFRSILGTVSTSESGIPYELKDEYLAKGYSLNDRVGTSYLEYQYEDILKGEKDVYEINNGVYTLKKEGRRGNDIVLTIDIELQKAVEDILTRQLIATKKEPNTEYYNRSFVVITDPNTGEILAMAGKQIVKEGNGYQIYDYTPGITTSPVVVGSVVKGASQLVGYNTGALKIGEIRDDSCIKLAATPEKCSWMYLGLIDDLSALKYSSNTYQFQTAMKVGKANYVYNGPLSIDTKAFETYRSMFAEFGLGVKTGIDLPIESLGYKGSSTVPGHLLDFSIGQYDTYTPIQLAQYIGTIANGGQRMQPYLLKQVYAPTKDGLTNLVSKTDPVVLNKISTTDTYLNRVKEGFKQVLQPGGTGYGYINLSYKPAGKTGTSQSFIDTNSDGVVDKETLTNTFAGYAPYDDPKVTFTVISPDISHYDNHSNYQTAVNSRIVSEVSKKFFEIYQ